MSFDRSHPFFVTAKDHYNASLIMEPDKLPSTARALELIVGLFDELKDSLIQECHLGQDEIASNYQTGSLGGITKTDWKEALRALAIEHVKIIEHARLAALSMLRAM